MKKLAVSLLSLLMVCFMLVTPAAAADEQASAKLFVEVNGEQVAFGEHGPILVDDWTLAPADPLFKALGITLEGSEEDGTIIGTKENVQVTLQAGEETVTINGEAFELQVAPRVINEVTYIPVRFISEVAGYDVSWDSATRTVLIETKVSLQGGRGFLWEVQHEGNTVYLLGSMHIADNSFYPLADAMEEAFAAADYLAVEADLTLATDPAFQTVILDASMYQDGSTLKDHLSEETYAQLGEVLTSLGLPADTYDQFKPWAVESTLTILKGQLSGLEGQAGIDIYFLLKAKEAQMPIIELEGFDYQFDMFNHFSPELQEMTLKSVLDNFYVLEESIDAMADMWKNGDDELLLSIIEQTAANEEYYKGMLVDRNDAMTDKIKAYLTAEEKAVYLVVVGAAHMIGESGIVTQLEKDGFTVTRK